MKGFRRAAAAAFPHTIPVLVCYLFMGIAAGLMLSSKGYHFGWSTLMAASVLSGTMQFMGGRAPRRKRQSVVYGGDHFPGEFPLFILWNLDAG